MGELRPARLGQADLEVRIFQRTAAHRTLPLDTTVRVTNLENRKSVKIRINDRGPYVAGRVIDLSARAAREIAIGDGLARVRIEVFASDQQVTENQSMIESN
jgi:rare lipoprotein A